MQISIRHTIETTIGEGLPRAVQHLLLTPQSSPVQDVKSWRLEAEGMDDATGFIDAYGNRAHLCTLTRPASRLTIFAHGIVETADRNGVVGRLERDPVPALFRRVTPLTKPQGAVVEGFRAQPRTGNERIALLHELMARVGEVLDEAPAQSQVQDGQSQAQGQARPVVAADYAHAFVGAARAFDIPARFVTGYLVPEDDAAVALHAWAEAWDDGLGWIAFDAMLNLCPTERHVRVACGLDGLSTVAVRSVPAASAGSAETVEITADG
ncbi:MAG TPA: transglutaminase family protein [Devosia sp.]|nr:transglutaminase family protein [Devosia sp.]